MARSARSPTARSSTPTGGSPRTRACSASPPPPRASQACCAMARRGRAGGAARACAAAAGGGGAGWSACSPATGSRTPRSRWAMRAPWSRASPTSARSSGPCSARERRPRSGQAPTGRGPMRRRRRIRVPASSANLGPGFDVLAAALALHVDVEVVETGRFGVHTDLSIARDRRNLVVRGFARLHAPDEFEFHIRSGVPLSGGLGTSAAAYVAGLLAADSIFELDADVLGIATQLEGHPDNVAAALLGGFVVCAEGEATRFDPPAGLEAVLVVPRRSVRTAKARAALPAEVPMGDAVFNVAHASLLVLGLAEGRLELIARGLDDRLHQPRRATLYPESIALVERARELGALGATISGAGPTVLVWSVYDATAGVFERRRAEREGWAEVRRVPFEPQGADVRALD